MTDMHDDAARPRDWLDEIAAALHRAGPGETVLLAPSRRVGRQWLDRLALRTGFVSGVRLSTLARLLLDYADRRLRRDGLRPIRREQALHLVGTAFTEVRPGAGADGYFTRLTPGFELTGTMLAALNDLDESGVQASRIGRALASREKADELSSLYRRVSALRRQAGLAGGQDVVAAALAGLDEDRDTLPMLLVPESIQENASAGQRRFLESWPERRRLVVRELDGAPAGTLYFQTGDCIQNEVRHVFRFLAARHIPFDRVELVCSDSQSYLPAILSALREISPDSPDELPLTSQTGLPVHLSRPARLLAAWLDWLSKDASPAGFARILWAGLLREDWRGEAVQLAGERLAVHLLTLPIHAGPAEWHAVLGRSEGDDELTAAEAWLARTLPEILPLANGGAALDPANADEVLRAAMAVLDLAAGSGKLDAYAKKALRETITAWRPYSGWPGFDAVAWLADLVRTTNVMGLGPLPGRIHVAGLGDGGHSGREWTFILGLDDSRFPGGSRQDPVLLDKERRHLSTSLEPSGRSRRRREMSMRRLLARLTGNVVLSHAFRDGASGRALFPAGLYSRLRSERHRDADMPTADVDSAVPTPAGAMAVLRPMAASECLCRRDDWLRVLLRHEANRITPADLALWHPALANGDAALLARASDDLTAWDGAVPAAGQAFLDGSRPLSPSNLEELAKCPADFFFRTVLGARPPDRFEPHPGVWLQANDRGTLLHDTFQDFLTELVEENIVVNDASYDICRTRLRDILDRHISRWRWRRPPRDDLAYRREVDELLEACVIFLAVEERRQATGRPLAFEAAIGGAREDEPPWRRIEPVQVTIPSGPTLTLRGRVDRIDRVDADGGLEILDYKTGSSEKYSRRDPFQGGRRLQPFLYVEMLVRALAEAGFPHPVRGFSYYFPMPRDEGKILAYSREQLSGRGWDILRVLGTLLSEGLFPLSGREDDIRYSDYRLLYTQTGEACRRALRKAEGNETLSAWLAMRKD